MKRYKTFSQITNTILMNGDICLHYITKTKCTGILCYGKLAEYNVEFKLAFHF